MQIYVYVPSEILARKGLSSCGIMRYIHPYSSGLLHWKGATIMTANREHKTQQREWHIYLIVSEIEIGYG